MEKIKIKKEFFENITNNEFIEIFQFEYNSSKIIDENNLIIFYTNIKKIKNNINKLQLKKYLSKIQVMLIAFLNSKNNFPKCEDCLKYKTIEKNNFILFNENDFAKNIKDKCECLSSNSILDKDAFNLNFNFFILNNFEKINIWISKFQLIFMNKQTKNNWSKYSYEADQLFVDIFNNTDTLKFHLFCISKNIYLGRSWEESFLNDNLKKEIETLQGSKKYGGQGSRKEFINLIHELKNKTLIHSDKNEIENLVNRINPININKKPKNIFWLINERNNIVHNSFPILECFPEIFIELNEKYSDILRIFKKNKKCYKIWKIKLILLSLIDYILTFYIILESLEFLE